MDWDLAIKRNSEALREIIAGLFAMLELAGGITVALLPRSVHSAVRRVLWPAESAMRRLIVIAARGLVVKLASPRPISRPKAAKPIGKGGGNRPPAFQLFDPRKNFPELRQPRVKYAKNPPRILFFGDHSRVDDLWPVTPARSRSSRPPMALSMRNVSAAGSRPSSWPSMICRARPGGWRAGGRGARPCQVRSSDHRSGPALHPAPAESPFTWSMRCSSNAMALPGTR